MAGMIEADVCVDVQRGGTALPTRTEHSAPWASFVAPTNQLDLFQDDGCSALETSISVWLAIS